MSAGDSSMIEEEDSEPPSKVQALSTAEDSYMIEVEDREPPSKVQALSTAEGSYMIKDRSKVVEEIPKAEDEQVDSDVEEYSSVEDDWSLGPETHLYWNLEHYPIPDGADLDSIYTNIKLALHRLGIHGWLEINAYGDEPNHADFDKFEYKYTFTPPEGGGKSTAGQMSRDILNIAYKWQPGRPVVVVLSEEHPELLRVLDSLHSRGYYVLRILPTPQLEADLFDSVRSVYRCTRFFGGGTTKPPPSPLTFKHNLGAKAGVFWDEVDCPFPSDQGYEEIHKKIISALRARDALGDISILVYLDERKRSLIGGKRRRDDDLLGICGMDLYGAGGDKTARLERMLNDVYLWVIDNCLSLPDPTDLIVVADGVRDDKEFLGVLEWLGGGGYSVFLLTPPKGTGPPERSDWPGFLFDHHMQRQNKNNLPCI